jgi:hypothetical protein
LSVFVKSNSIFVFSDLVNIENIKGHKSVGKFFLTINSGPSFMDLLDYIYLLY